MNAKILDLHGKYYGTEIEYEINNKKCIIEIWNHASCIPSQRQIKYWHCSLQEAKDNDFLCDDHYETAEDFYVAQKIVDALNN